MILIKTQVIHSTFDRPAEEKPAPKPKARPPAAQQEKKKKGCGGSAAVLLLGFIGLVYWVFI